MTRKISIVNFKGGTGKSSLTENLAYALAQEGRTVLVVDDDRQSNSSTTLLDGAFDGATLTQVLKREAPIEKAIKLSPKHQNLFVIPAGRELDTAANYVSGSLANYQVLRRAIATLDYDYIFFDHAGAVTPMMEAALLSSEEMLVPCLLEPYAVQGLFDMFQRLAEILVDHELVNSGIIPFRLDMRYEMTKQYLRELEEAEEFEGLVLQPIRTDSAVPVAQSNQMTIFEFEAKHKIKSRAAEDIRALAQQIMSQEVK